MRQIVAKCPKKSTHAVKPARSLYRDIASNHLRTAKKIDSFETNSDYSAMETNHNNTVLCVAKMRRVIVLPVWRARQWPVVDSKI
jgi:hypothetical protein